MESFAVVDVSSWFARSDEQRGTKEKEWLSERADSEELWLWKATREDAGEDWSEKVAAELAALIELPHATCELASRAGKRGIISRDFRTHGEAFVPGNELLWRLDPNYPKERVRGVSQYTIEAVFEFLYRWPFARHGKQDPAHVFAGYLLFDAWIGNQDRHHQNWGIILGGQQQFSVLAPSFDHAASLGHNERDESRKFRLVTRDRRARIETWASKATSQFYPSESSRKPLTTFEAFHRTLLYERDAGWALLERIAGVKQADLEAIFQRVPESLMSPTTRHFALQLLAIDRERLLEGRPG